MPEPHEYLTRIHTQQCQQCTTTETWTETFLVGLTADEPPRRILTPTKDLSLPIPHTTTTLPTRPSVACHRCITLHPTTADLNGGTPTPTSHLHLHPRTLAALGPFGARAALQREPLPPISPTTGDRRPFVAPGRRQPAAPAAPAAQPRLPADFSDLPSFT